MIFFQRRRLKRRGVSLAYRSLVASFRTGALESLTDMADEVLKVRCNLPAKVLQLIAESATTEAGNHA
jgi:hypothetical protein